MIKVKIKESTQREKDEILPGWEEMQRLAHGIMQEDDELTEKEKKKKRNCSKGNPYHTGKDGRFTSKDDAGSFSLSEPVRGRDCTSGQSSMPGRKIVKKDRRLKPPRCGRDKPDGSKKARRRCRDGSLVWESEQPQKMIRVRIKSKPKTESIILAMPPEWKEQKRIQEAQDEFTDKLNTIADEPDDTSPVQKSDNFSSVQSKYMTFINSLTHEERIQIKSLFCYDRFSLKQWNNFHKASDGKLNEPTKK